MEAVIIMSQIPNQRHSGVQLVCCYNNGLNLPSACIVLQLLLPVYGKGPPIEQHGISQGISDKCNPPINTKFKHNTDDKTPQNT
jgi:hypothetical protein